MHVTSTAMAPTGHLTEVQMRHDVAEKLCRIKQERSSRITPYFQICAVSRLGLNVTQQPTFLDVVRKQMAKSAPKQAARPPARKARSGPRRIFNLAIEASHSRWLLISDSHQA